LNKNQRHFGIIAHSGAGGYRFTSLTEVSGRKKILTECANRGYQILARGGSALDAVESAINIMENSKIFNCGGGSCIAADGSLRMDAAVMTGDLRCGAVADSNVTGNPVSLARQVMERSGHVLIVGSKPLHDFCKLICFETEELRPTKIRKKQFEKYLSEIRREGDSKQSRNWGLISHYLKGYNQLDTVGAVARDRQSRVCVGVSTGGIWMKLPGRVGDSPIIGAGLYADDYSGAACATGTGEEIIRVCLSKTACDYMKQGMDAQSACDEAVRLISRIRGTDTAGLIAIDKNGNYGASWNTEVLSRSFRFARMRRPFVSVLPMRRKL